MILLFDLKTNDCTVVGIVLNIWRLGNHNFFFNYTFLSKSIKKKMPVPAGAIGGQQSCFDKIRLGFMMGAVIGGSIGLLLGGVGGFR